MATLLFTIGGAVVNALAFSGTNFVFSRFTDHGEKERKTHDLALENLQRARDKWNEDRNSLISSIKDYVNKTRQGHISIMLTRQWWNSIAYLQNK